MKGNGLITGHDSTSKNDFREKKVDKKEKRTEVECAAAFSAFITSNAVARATEVRGHWPKVGGGGAKIN